MCMYGGRMWHHHVCISQIQSCLTFVAATNDSRPLAPAQDGFEQLNKQAESLKSRLQIRFIDQYGLEEAGIDGGGLFKEFMECLVKEGFDPNAGLFKATSDNRLYPNPAAQTLVPNALAYLQFLGRMLGKAMYEVVHALLFLNAFTALRLA